MLNQCYHDRYRGWTFLKQCITTEQHQCQLLDNLVVEIVLPVGITTQAVSRVDHGYTWITANTRRFVYSILSVQTIPRVFMSSLRIYVKFGKIIITVGWKANRKWDRDEIWQDCSSSRCALIDSQVSDMQWYFQYGGYDIWRHLLQHPPAKIMQPFAQCATVPDP